MSTVSHEPSRIAPKTKWVASLRPLGSEAWASLAIVVMWLSVLVSAVWGPDIENSTAGGDHSTLPSAVAVALFAFLATWVVARYGFRRERKED